MRSRSCVSACGIPANKIAAIDCGSLINSDVLQSLVLRNGAYPQQYGDRIGA